MSYAGYFEKRFTQIYKDLYGDAMLVSLWGAQNNMVARKPTETSVSQFSYKSMNSLLEELTKIKVILIFFWGKGSLDCKISKNW